MKSDDSKTTEEWQLAVEFYLWLLTPIVWTAYATFFGVPEGKTIFSTVSALVPLLYLIGIPTLFFLIFGTLPLAYVRKRRKLRDFGVSSFTAKLSPLEEDPAAEIEQSQSIRRLRFLQEQSQLRTVHKLAAQSKEVAENFRARAGIFLLGGLVIALSGVGFFYIQTPRSFDGASLPTILATLAPNFGVLFFIEFVALYLLRQYRPLMDEYRHYEAIQRHREEVAALFNLLDEQDIKIDPLNLVKDGHYFSLGELLETGKSTMLLESKKMERDEVVGIWSKLIDALPRPKA